MSRRLGGGRPDARGLSSGSPARTGAAITGGVLVGLGFIAALAALALPWARYRVRADAVTGAAADDVGGNVLVFQLDRGSWYVVCLFALFGLAVGAALASPRQARWAGVAAVMLGLAGLLLAIDQANRLSASSISLNLGLARMDMVVTGRGGMWYGMAAAPLLGIGAGLLSVRRPAGPATSRADAEPTPAGPDDALPD